jgi:aminoglycoside phosphotransferase family enzyme
MDLSTLERRRAVCEREIEINRRLAPEIYLACVPIVRRPDGGLQLGGDGEPLEWAVRMRRFDQSALLSRIAEAGSLSADLARDLADTVEQSHRGAPPAPGGEAGAEGSAKVRRLIASVSATLAGLAHTFAVEAPAVFRARAGAQMERAAAILDRRAAAGCIRRCHGDLHLNNIVLWQGRPVLFDALEFDEELATVDTLYDLAFLLMDLDRRGQREAANAVLNRYLWRSGTDLRCGAFAQRSGAQGPARREGDDAARGRCLHQGRQRRGLRHALPEGAPRA